MAKYLDSAGLTRVWGKISNLFARKSELVWTKLPADGGYGTAMTNSGNEIYNGGEVAVGMYNCPMTGADGVYSIFTVGCGSLNDGKDAFLVGTNNGYGSTPHTFIYGVGGFDGVSAYSSSPVDRILRKLSYADIDNIILNNSDNTTPDESW